MFPEINKNRLRFLFRRALTAAQLKSFLDDHRSALVMHGAQYHRRGRGAQSDLNFLIGLPDRCIAAVRNALMKELPATESPLPEALIAQFQAVECSNGKMSSEVEGAFAEAGLRYLLQQNPPEVWLEFLKTPIGEAPLSTRSESKTDVNSIEPDGGLAVSERATLAVVLDVVRRIRHDDGESARARLADLPQGEVRTELEELLTRHRARAREQPAVPRTLRVLESTNGIDQERISVLVERARQGYSDQPLFLDVRGIWINHALYAVTEGQAQDLFEHRQHVIGFPDQKGARLPVQGELSLWHIEKYPTDKPIKYRLRKPAEPVFVVVPITASLKEFDEVRTEIQNAAVESWMRPIFRLAGGGFVRLPADGPNPLRKELDEPLYYYRTLPVWNIDDLSIVIGPLPPRDGEYDCADLAAVTGRILRQSEARKQLPALSKSQVGAFIDALRASDMGLTEQRLDRIALGFDRYLTSAERLDQVSKDVLGLRQINDAIEAAKRGAVEQMRAENEQLRSDRTRLERELVDLKDRRSALIDENKRITDDVRNVVRRAFEKAKDAGVKSLGELAIFSAFMQVDKSETDKAESNIERTADLAMFSSDRAADLRKSLEEIGVTAPTGRLLVRAVRHIALAGLPILVVGARAAQVAVALGRGLAQGQCVVADVSVGIIDSSGTRQLLESSTAADSIVIRNYNLSAFESYGNPIVDQLVVSVVSQQPIRASVIFSAARGAAALPLDDELSALCVTVDASGTLTAPELDLDLVLERLREDRSSARIRSAALVRILERLSRDAPDEREAVLALISAQMPPYPESEQEHDL